MKYKYTAFSKKGSPVSGVISAVSAEEAKDKLEQKGLTVEQVKSKGLPFINKLSEINVGGVGFKDRLLFTRNLAIMIKAGLTLDDALSILSEQSTSPLLTKIIDDINEEIKSGKSLAESMEKYPKVFNNLYTNIISASEQSGTLQESLLHLAKQMSQQYEIHSKVKNALFYPIIVVTATFLVAFLLSIFVLPQVTKIFESFDADLPWTTRIIIGFSDFVSEHTIWMVLIAIATVVSLVIISRLKALKSFWHNLFLYLPIIKVFTKNFNLSLFSRTLGTLLKSGVNINEAIEITAKTMKNRAYRKALKEIAVAQQTGETLGTLLSGYPHLFTPMVYRMVTVGEESGNLEDVLAFLAEFHDKELDYFSRNLTTIMEPVILIMIGLMVAVVALAIIMPIYQITGDFQVGENLQ